MGIAKKGYDFLKNNHVLNILSDKQYTKLKYRLKMGRALNLRNPRAFTEKLNWLKLYDHNPIYVPLVDKWEVTKYVEQTIGGEYCIKKLGLWSSFDEIDFSKLPNQFVLKCTNDSGGIVICRDKSKLDTEDARRILERSLKTNYYWHNREWPYKEVKPRILAEEYLVDESGDGLQDYKFFCFDGEPQFMFIATGRASHQTCFDFFDMDFNWIPVKQHYPNAVVTPRKPEQFETMKQLARQLSKDFKHVRVDFFAVGDRVYFGELTFTHFGGFERFEPESYDYKFGEYLQLDIPEDKRKL